MRELNREYWPHKVVIDSDSISEVEPMEQWLQQEVGGFKSRWHVVYCVNHSDFYFQKQQDATWFALRWT